MEGLLLLLLGLLGSGGEPQMSSVYQWKQIDFNFRNKAARANFIQNNTFPLDAEYSREDPWRRMFVTTPKFLKGVPASLSTVENGFFTYNLKPYPSWDAHSDTDCNKIISVLRIKMTDCGHLWVIDSGVVEVLSSFTVACPPKLLVYNLKTDQEVWRYEIPDKDYKPNESLLGTVEVNGDCNKEHVYIADITGYGIIVVDRASETSWRVENELMTFEPGSTHYNVDGQEFDLNDGVISLTSSTDLLYFHSLSGKKEHWVPIDVINNENNRNSLSGFQTSPGERSGQSGPEALARGGDVMLFSNVPESSLYCWKTDMEYVSSNLHRVFKNTETFKFTSGMKVIRDYSGIEYLLAVTSPFGNIMNGNVNPNQVNYRILRAPVKYLLQYTPCKN